MSYSMEPIKRSHRSAVTRIFNYFVANSFAAYFDTPAGPEFFDGILRVTTDYPSAVVKAPDGSIVGFGFLRPYHPAATFRRTALIGYFILPEHTRLGLGTALLERFVSQAREMGVDQLLASISSANEPSLAFHRRHGFVERGRLQDVGRKFGQDFDEVWMQKMIA
jgi:L-amino acid N-acyltransferase YncA